MILFVYFSIILSWFSIHLFVCMLQFIFNYYRNFWLSGTRSQRIKEKKNWAKSNQDSTAGTHTLQWNSGVVVRRQESKDLTRRVKGNQRLKAAAEEKRGSEEGAKGWRMKSWGVERVSLGQERRRVCMRCRRKVVEACGRGEAGERGVSGEVEVGGMNKCGRSGNDRNTEC